MNRETYRAYTIFSRSCILVLGILDVRDLCNLFLALRDDEKVADAHVAVDVVYAMESYQAW